MYKNKRILAIIPARGGSKGVPKKNIKDLAGKPLIVWTIEFALSTGFFDDVLVSTDDETIASVSKCAGANVPFMRPADLSGDDIPTLPVLVHAAEYLKINNKGFDYVVLLEPTNPLRNGNDLKNMLDIMETKAADSVVSVSKVSKSFNPNWQLTIQEGLLKLFSGGGLDELIGSRQKLADTYIRNGSIYIFRFDMLFGERPTIYGNISYPYIMNDNESFDINNDEDFRKAEDYILKK